MPQAPPPPPGPDSLRAVLDSVFAEPGYVWDLTSNPLGFLARWWRQLLEWLNGLEARFPGVLNVVGYLLVAVLLAIIGHAAWVMIRTLRAAERPPPAGPPGGRREPRTAEWHRREAERLAGLGAYAEAMPHRFQALVLDLAARGIVQYHPSKTPGDYLREARLEPSPRDALQRTVAGLYGCLFARRPCGAEEFAQWSALTTPERYAAPG